MARTKYDNEFKVMIVELLKWADLDGSNPEAWITHTVDTRGIVIGELE